MTVLTGFVLFAIIWWTVLFAVLPIGVGPAHEDDGSGVQPGAPKNPRIGRKFAITTLVSAVVWLAIFGLVEANVFSFRDWAEQDDVH
jgi:predicted secreted protein